MEADKRSATMCDTLSDCVGYLKQLQQYLYESRVISSQTFDAASFVAMHSDRASVNIKTERTLGIGSSFALNC